MNYAKFLNDEIKKVAEKKAEPVAALIKAGGKEESEGSTTIRTTEQFNPSYQALIARINSGKTEGVADLDPEVKNSLLRGLTYLSRPQNDKDIQTIKKDPDYEWAKRWLVQFAGMPKEKYYSDEILKTGWTNANPRTNW